MIKYVLDLNIHFEENDGIPIAIDYGCELSECSGHFKSFESVFTKDIT
jgi:hypothetical protein